MKTLIAFLLLCSPALAQTPDFNFCANPWRPARSPLADTVAEIQKNLDTINAALARRPVGAMPRATPATGEQLRNAYPVAGGYQGRTFTWSNGVTEPILPPPVYEQQPGVSYQYQQAQQPVSYQQQTPYGLSPIGTRHADGSVTVGYGQPYYTSQATGQAFNQFSYGSSFGAQVCVPGAP